jgi:cysteine desulfurase
MVNSNKAGQVTAQAISEAITPRTALVSLSWGNGLTGVVNPVGDIAKLCKERGIRFHLDATHVIGKLYFEQDEIGAHYITFNGDHLHAPKGTGGLFIQAGTKCSPLIVGGIEQTGFRAGSFDIPGFIALGQAAKEAKENRDLLCTEVARLRDKLEMGIVAGYPDAVPFYADQERLPNCTTIAFPGIANEAMLYALNRKGVYACIGGGSYQQIGLILMGAGVEEVLAQTAVSFSLSRETHEEEIERSIEIVVETAKKLRKLSKKLI